MGLGINQLLVNQKISLPNIYNILSHMGLKERSPSTASSNISTWPVLLALNGMP